MDRRAMIGSGERAWLLRAWLVWAMAVAGVGLAACSDDDDESGESSGEEASGEGAAANLDTDFDLLEHAHLAVVDHRGLYIDFGTPAQDKYTSGDWNSGWGSRGTDGDVTYAQAGRRGRIYFHADETGARHVRLRLRPKGTGALTPYVNNEQLQSIFFEGESWQDVDFEIPAEHVRRGENYLLLTFGGVETIRGEEVSVQMASVHVGESAPGAGYEAPAWGTTVANVSLGGAEKRALVYATPVTFTYYVEVPEDGRLTFSVGQEGEAGGTARVFATPEGGSEAKLFEASLTSGWNAQNLDLSAHAGNIVQLRFEAEGGAGRVAWAAPRIAVPARPAPEIAQAKNVVVLLIDTLRASKLQAWNPESRVRTPAIDALAEGGVVFERAQSPENWTKPSVASVLTGLHPVDHGARTQAAALPDSALMLSEHMKSNGFATAGFIANGYVSREFGFDQGWDLYRNYIRENLARDAEDLFDDAAEWALEHRDERFFLYVQTIDPHVPYDPGDEYLEMYDPRSNYEGQVSPRSTGDLLHEAKGGRITFTQSDIIRLKALHDGEITQHDVHLARFVERMKEAGLWEDTLFVLVSDHGEEFNEHGSWGHGHSIYQELLNVPLMFHFEGKIEASRVPASVAVNTLDIPPTVTEIAGVPPMPNIAGRSLVPYLAGQRRSGPQVAWSDFLDERRVAVAGRWKFLIRGNLTSSLFDLQEDPWEENQLDANDHPIATRYLRVLQGQFLGAENRAEWLSAEQQEGVQLNASDAEVDDELQQQLRELGYIN